MIVAVKFPYRECLWNASSFAVASFLNVQRRRLQFSLFFSAQSTLSLRFSEIGTATFMCSDKRSYSGTRCFSPVTTFFYCSSAEARLTSSVCLKRKILQTLSWTSFKSCPYTLWGPLLWQPYVARWAADHEPRRLFTQIRFLSLLSRQPYLNFCMQVHHDNLICNVNLN